MSLSDNIYDVASQATSNMREPASSKVFQTSLSLVAGTSVPFDLKPLINLHRIDNVQGIFIDNSKGTNPIMIDTVAGVPIIIPNGYQGLMPLYLSADNVITFAGAGVVNIALLNFATPVAVWPAISQTLPVNGSGYVETTDVALDALIRNGGLPALGVALTTADATRTLRAGNPINSLIGTLQTGVNLITGAPSFFMTGIIVHLTNASATTAGTIQFGLFQTSGPIIFNNFPITLTTTPQNMFNILNISGVNVIGALAGDNLRYNLIAGTSSGFSGELSVTVFGGTTGVA